MIPRVSILIRIRHFILLMLVLPTIQLPPAMTALPVVVVVVRRISVYESAGAVIRFLEADTTVVTRLFSSGSIMMGRMSIQFLFFGITHRGTSCHIPTLVHKRTTVKRRRRSSSCSRSRYGIISSLV